MPQRDSCFVGMALKAGVLHSLVADHHQSELAAWSASRLVGADEGSHFGFVLRGEAELCHEAGRFLLRAGLYFCAPGRFDIEGDGEGIVVTRRGYRGLFTIGGPIEERGRLRYIDGCSDSLLVPPVVYGDPCLNLLHLPPGTDQTEHTHPSARIGLIVSGAGRCLTPHGVHALEPGLAFVIPPESLHRFKTGEECLRIIAYHPDSDFGPTHENHPMVNRTLVEGQPVRRTPFGDLSVQEAANASEEIAS